MRNKINQLIELVRGLQYTQEKAEQGPVILQDTSKKLPTGCERVDNVMVVMSRSEAEFLKNNLKQVITIHHEEELNGKGLASILYKHSDPADPETTENFKTLNRVRNTLRELKRRRKMLANIQKALKIAVKA